MSYKPDDRHERDVHPSRIATCTSVTLDKDKYEKNLIRSSQATDAMAMYDFKNSQSRPIAPASLNPSGAFLPHTFGVGIYSSMPPVMMHNTPGTVPTFLPFPRHMPTLAVSGAAAAVHISSRPSLATPSRPAVVAHHMKPAGLPGPLHAIPGITLPVRPASTALQQTRSPSPKLLSDSSTVEVVKAGDIKSQAAPTEAHSVVETRPAGGERPTYNPHHVLGSSNSKTSSTVGLGKSTSSITASSINTPKHPMSTTAHIPSSSTIGGPIPSVSSNFNVPKVIANVGPTGMGQLYSQPSSVSFTTRSPQLQDHTRLLKPTSETSTASFAAHVTPSASVISSPAVASISNSRIDANRQFPVPLPRMPSFFDGHTVSLPPTGKPYIAPIESVVRKPTSIAQIHSTSHVTTGINSVQLKASHNSPVSVAVVNMGVQLTKSEAESKNHQTKSSLPNSTCIFSVQNMLSNTQSSSSNSSSSNIVTSLSPRPSILRKRPDTLRKPISQPSFDDSQITTTNDLTGNIRADGLQSNSLTIQNSPKSENVINALEGNTKAVENGSSHPSIISPAKIKREFSSPLSAQHVVAPAVNTISLSSVSHDAGASPRKKPRKQNVVATEDKFGSLPPQVSDIHEIKSVVSVKIDEEEEEELKFLRLRRGSVSIYGGYKVNNKAAHNHFERYSDVKPKDERKASLQEIANERSIRERATGWKIHHVAAQLDELKSCEEEVLLKMCEFREGLPKYKSDHKRYEDMVMLHELLLGNIQRSQLVIEQLGETKKTTVKILDHQQGIMDIIKKNIKRHVKKKS